MLWPTFGNHDAWSANSATQSGPYYAIFTLPTKDDVGGIPSGTEAYYAFNYGNVHFVCLDASESARASAGPMLSWLARDLAANHAQWTIAFWHQPPYSKGSRNSDTEPDMIEMRQNALPILEAYGVDLVLGGHSHSYERSYLLHGHYGASNTFTASMLVDGGDGQEEGDGAYVKPAGETRGTVYVVLGAAAEVMPGGALNHPAMVSAHTELGSLVIDVEGERLDAKLIDTAGEVLDHFTVLKESAPELFSASFQDGVTPSPRYLGTRDTYLAAAQPSTAFGGTALLKADGDVPVGAAQEQVSLLAWSLESIPKDATVESARITFNVSNPSASAYRLFELKRPWQEGAATWTSYAAGSLWAAPGASGPADRGSTILGEVRARALGAYTLTLNPAALQLLQAWVAKTQPNYGFVLANRLAGDGLEVASSNTPPLSKRPQLEVVYTLRTPRLVKVTSTVPLGSSDPAGLTFVPSRRHLVLVDSEVEEAPFHATSNQFELTLGGARVAAQSTLAFSREPTDITFNTVTGTVFITDDDLHKVFEVNAASGALISSFPAPESPFDTLGKLPDPEGISFDPATGNLFIADDFSRTLFKTTRTGSVLAACNLDLPFPADVHDPEAVHFDPRSGHLFVVSGARQFIYEFTANCQLVSRINLQPLGIVAAKGIVFAPSSVAGADPNEMHIYIADYGLDSVADGRLFELALD